MVDSHLPITSVLENGLRIVTETVPTARSISLGVLVGASPQDDPADRLGLAHLVEHAVFDGTVVRNATEIARLMDAAGGQMGAFTTRDYTCFSADVLDDYLPYALDLLGDLLLNATFPDSAIALQRQIIEREIRLAADSPGERVHEALKRHIWSGHPLGRPIAGKSEHLSRMTRDDALSFVQRQYKPNRMVIAASGNVDHERLVEQARDAFWRLSGTAEREQVPCRFRSGVHVEAVPASQAYFTIAVPADPYDHHDRYRLHILNTLLGGGMSSRLFRRLRSERGLAYSIQSEHHAYMDAGAIVIEGSTAPGTLLPTIGSTFVELIELFSGERSVTEEEAWTARMQIQGRHRLASEHLPTRMSRLATQEFYFGHSIPEGEILSALEETSEADLMGWSRSVMCPRIAEAAISVVTPTASDVEISGEASLIRQLTGLLDDFAKVAVSVADDRPPICPTGSPVSRTEGRS